MTELQSHIHLMVIKNVEDVFDSVGCKDSIELIGTFFNYDDACYGRLAIAQFFNHGDRLVLMDVSPAAKSVAWDVLVIVEENIN